MGQVYATFTGIAAVKSVTVPRTLGIFPNSIILTAQPQPGVIPPGGVLTVGHGTDFVTMTDIKVDWASFRASTQGHILTIKLLDRRWRWKYFPISGRYNVRLADGTIDPATQKTPQELATLLFQAMYEVGFDVSQLPNGGYPAVDWTYERSDVLLHQLCADRGCDISLGLDNAARIVQLGVGNNLPLDDDVMSPSFTADPPEGPDVVLVVCGESLFESRLKLKPVGLDTDGKIKAIDDLSYKPAGGWGGVADENFFEQMREEGKTEQEIRLAKRTVFRWYQIDTQSDGTQYVPGYGTVDEITQLLPLNDYLLDTYTVSGTSTLENKPYVILGKFVVLTDPPTDDSDDEIVEYDGESSLSKKLGVVKFPRRMVKYVGGPWNSGSADKLEPAELYLQTSYGVRENDTLQSERFVAERNLTGGTVLQEAVRIEEIALATRATYDSDEITVSGTTDNQASVDSQTETILDSLQSAYTFGVYGSVMYRGIKAIQTDGAIRQTVWYVSDSSRVPSRTVASRNSEVALGPIRAFERRRRRLLEANSDVALRKYQDSRVRASGGYR